MPGGALVRRARTAGAVLGLLAVVACTAPESPPPPDPDPPEVTATVCREPRPEMCTQEYRPVCADRDTGVRCVTTPCPSTEQVTYSNACTACSDPKVMRHRPGACPPNDR